MSKKIIKIDGKTYLVNSETKEMEEVDLEEEDSKEEETPKEEPKEETPKEDNPEEFKEDIDKAAKSLMKELGIDELKKTVDNLNQKVSTKKNKKVSALIDLEKTMKKDVKEMTNREKIVGFFQAMIQNNQPALKALAEGTAADGGYLFPDEFRYEVVRDLAEQPRMRNEVTVVPMTKDIMKVPTLADGPQVSWTEENAEKSTKSCAYKSCTTLIEKAVNCWNIFKNLSILKTISSQAKPVMV